MFRVHIVGSPIARPYAYEKYDPGSFPMGLSFRGHRRSVFDLTTPI